MVLELSQVSSVKTMFRLGPSCMKPTPAAWISFMCYEACKRILSIIGFLMVFNLLSVVGSYLLIRHYKGFDCCGPSIFIEKPSKLIVYYIRVSYLELVDVWNFAISRFGLVKESLQV